MPITSFAARTEYYPDMPDPIPEPVLLRIHTTFGIPLLQMHFDRTEWDLN